VIGPGTLEIIRTVLPYAGPDPADLAEQTDTADPGTVAVPRAARVAELFAPTVRARYPRLIDELTTSRVPDAALEKIAEPLPPADPLVDLRAA
jgi:hypothetical protein